MVALRVLGGCNVFLTYCNGGVWLDMNGEPGLEGDRDGSPVTS
jgi:hypothetical protein